MSSCYWRPSYSCLAEAQNRGGSWLIHSCSERSIFFFSTKISQSLVWAISSVCFGFWNVISRTTEPVQRYTPRHCNIRQEKAGITKIEPIFHFRFGKRDVYYQPRGSSLSEIHVRIVREETRKEKIFCYYCDIKSVKSDEQATLWQFWKKFSFAKAKRTHFPPIKEIFHKSLTFSFTYVTEIGVKKGGVAASPPP